MPKYRISGKIYEADSPDEARAMAAGTAEAPREMGFIERQAGSALAGAARPILKLKKKLGGDADAQLKAIEPYDAPVANFIGETALTAPVGGAVGKGLQGASRGIRALSKVAGRATLPGKVLQRAGSVIGGSGARNITEGAVIGGLLADDTGEGAAAGAGMGAALSVAPPALRRVLAKGAVKKSVGADDAVKWVGERAGQRMDLPLAQKARGGVAKWFYQDFIPLFPGAGGALERQSAKAAGQWRRRGLQEVADAAGMGDLPANAGDAKVIEHTIRDISKGLSQRFDETLNQYAFNTPRDAAQRVTARLSRNPTVIKGDYDDITATVEKLVGKYDENGVLTGRAVSKIRKELAKAGREAGDPSIGQGFHEAAETFADLVDDEMVTPRIRQYMQQVAAGGAPRTRLTQAELQAYEDYTKWITAREGWKKFLPFDRAVTKAAANKSGAFDVADLVSAVDGNTTDATKLSAMIKHGRSSISEPLTESSLAGRRAALAAASAVGLGAQASAAGIIPAMATGAAVLGAARGAATPSAQRFLMGELSGQRALEKALRKWAPQNKTAGRVLRNAIVSEQVDEE